MKKVLDIGHQQIGVHMHPDHDYVRHAGADSLDSVELIMAMEETFGHEIPDVVAASHLNTPRQVAEYIRYRQHMGKRKK